MNIRTHTLPKGESIAPMPKLIPTMQRSMDMSVISGAFSFVVPTTRIPRVIVGGGLMPKGSRNQFSSL